MAEDEFEKYLRKMNAPDASGISTAYLGEKGLHVRRQEIE